MQTVAQKGVFVILRNAVFLEDEKKSAPDLYRRDDRHGKRLRNRQFDGLRFWKYFSKNSGNETNRMRSRGLPF